MKEEADQPGKPPNAENDEESNANKENLNEDILLFTYSRKGEKVELERLLDKKKKTDTEQKKKKEEEGTNFSKFLNQKDARENTVIHYAMKNGHKDILELMLKYGGTDLRLEEQNLNKMKPLHFAARYGKNGKKVWECIEWLEDNLKRRKKAKFRIEETDAYGYNIFHHSIQNNHYEDVVDEEKDEDEDYNDDEDKDEDDYQNLEEKKSDAKNLCLLKKLVKRQEFTVKQEDGKGNTSLHIAAMNKKFNVLKFLFSQAKHDLKAKSKEGKMNNLEECLFQGNNKKQLPIHIACQMGDLRSVKLILDFLKNFKNVDDKKTNIYDRKKNVDNKKKNVDDKQKKNDDKKKNSEDNKKTILDAKDDNLNRPLDLAIESGVIELIKLLRINGAQLYDKEEEIYSIHTCARVGDEKLMKAILDNYVAEVTDKINEKIIDAMVDADEDAEEEVENIIEGSWSPDDKDNDGKTAFFHAAEKNKDTILNLFLTWPPHEEENSLIPPYWNNKDKEGQGPLMVALKEGHEASVRVLLETKQPGRLGDVKNFLREDDFRGNNIFHSALLSKKPEKMTKILLSTIEKNGLSDGMFDRLTECNFNEETPIYALADSDQKLDKSELEKLMRYLDVKNKLAECLGKTNAGNETPFHIAARKGYEDFISVIFEISKSDDSNINVELIQNLLKTADEDGNTPLHLSTQGESFRKTDTVALIMKILGKEKEAVKEEIARKNKFDKTPFSESAAAEIVRKNKFDKTPFSESAAAGDLESLRKMLSYLNKDKSEKWRKIRKTIVDEKDLEGSTPLIKSSKEGHVDIFKYLLKKGADIKKRTSKNQTALDIAIEYNRREIITAIIENEKWKEAFREPCIKNKLDSENPKMHLRLMQSFRSSNEKLDTPMRKLIREFPDLAEKVLDKCWSVTGYKVKMNFEFIEDTFNYRKSKNDPGLYYNFHSDPHPEPVKEGVRQKMEGLTNEAREYVKQKTGNDLQREAEEGGMKKTDESKKQKETSYEKPYSNHTVPNHPLMIMATERKLNLLQHPLCLALIKRKWSDYGFRYFMIELFSYIVFLVFLSSYILSSPGPLTSPELFQCSSNYFKNFNNHTHAPLMKDSLFSNSLFNDVSRIGLFIVCAIRLIVMFFITEEIWVIKKKFDYNEIHWKQLETYPIGLFLDITTTILAIYVASDEFYSTQWYAEDIKVRACIQWNVSAFTLTAGWINLLFHMRQLFGIGKYIILFNDVIITFLSIFPVILIMIIGFGLGFHILLSNQERFSKPEYAVMKTIIMFSGEFDYGDIFFPEADGSAPFPYMTYIMFLAFFFLLSLVSINVLIGLTLDDIQKFLGNADLRNLSTKIKYILQMEESKTRVTRKQNFEQFYDFDKTNDLFNSADLVSKSRICELLENKQNEAKCKAEQEKESAELRKFIKEQIKGVQEQLEEVKEQITVGKQTERKQDKEAEKTVEAVEMMEPDKFPDETRRSSSSSCCSSSSSSSSSSSILF